MAVGELHGRPIAISGGSDSTVRVCDLGTGDPVGEPFTGHTDAVGAVAVGELHGRPIAISGGFDSTVRVWDLGTGRPVGEIRLGVSVLSVTKPKNDFVVAGHRTGLTALRI